MAEPRIVIQGAREHNLREVSLELPRDRLIVVTGVSGSGKSSLAFDTIYAEGQRRYVESLSSAARQYLGQLRRPDVDRIEGLSPAIAIQQKAGDSNPRSTVATVTEIYDYLRVLYARLGEILCCGRPVGRQTTAQIVDRIAALAEGTRVQVMAPVARQRKGEFQEVFEDARKAGFVRVRVDGEVLDLSERIELDRQRRHDLELVVDRLIVKDDMRARLAESVELAVRHGEGQLVVAAQAPGSDESEDILFSRDLSCPYCGTSYEEPSPQLFSFNSLQGMCPACHGLGQVTALDPDRCVPDPSRSINQGAVAPWGEPGTLRLKHILAGLAKHFRFSLDAPWRELPDELRHLLLYGTDERIQFTYVSHRGRTYPYQGRYAGVLASFQDGDGGVAAIEEEHPLNRYVRTMPCLECGGTRLCATARKVVFADRPIYELCALTIDACAAFFDEVRLEGRQALIGEDLVREIRGRLNFLLDVGLHYLSLDRPAPTLSGGEGQRIRLASQIGAGLVGVTYVLDEPSIGLHHRDNQHLIRTLCRLRDMGNTVIVVEHDEETMRAADHLVDVGPGPGRHGGEIVAAGTADELAHDPRSVTGKYLNGEQAIAVPAARRALEPDRRLLVRRARQNNLKELDVAIPLGALVCVTGVSGSGKSSLVNEILYKALARDLNRAGTSPGEHDGIDGLELLDKVINIDQSPIGRTPRSNPATYTKVLDPIRALFAKLPEAKVRGYAVGRFSFNVADGRCDACEGLGYQRIEMDFLDDVWVECDRCGGSRFAQDTLQVRYKGRHIADVLHMTVAEALEHFTDIPPIARTLQTLHDVGLDYVQLGQPAPTLSGGEAQRIKLARELSKRSTGRTLYLLDEPTTGLHFTDIQKLLDVLGRFVDDGNTVIVIEHNLDVIKVADWVIDLGPEGGAAGGYLVAEGTPEQVAACAASHTGVSLRPALGLGVSDGVRPSPRGDGAGRPSPWAPLDEVVVKGARAHNLQDVDAVIPRDKLTVLTGVSGSGKSSLAIDTIYAEGQRRYVESLSSYARQFIRQLEKPPVDFVSGLSPAISIEQRPGSRNPRSTVGTVTEIHDYLRLLYARLGERRCIDCDGRVGRQTVDDMIDRILLLPEGARLNLLAPLVLGRTETYDEAFARLRRDGFLRVRINGAVRELEEEPSIDRRRRHSVEVVVDRLIVRPDQRGRVAEAVETALERGDGRMIAEVLELPDESSGIHPGDILFSRRWTCAGCGRAYEELTPQSFSFNTPLGWCERCEGLGFVPGLDPERLAARRDLSLAGGAVPLLGLLIRRRPFRVAFQAAVESSGWDPREPLEDWPEHELERLFFGVDAAVDYITDDGGRSTVRYAGLVPTLEQLYEHGHYREQIADLRRDLPCATCAGSRLRPEAAAVRLRGRTILEVSSLPLHEAAEFVETIALNEREATIAAEPLREARRRLRFLLDVGLEYLALGRPSGTLSGGEAQRIRLASQIGSGLTGVLYILDEPTIGLHPRDNDRLLRALEHLRDLGNTVLMVEHDAEAIRRSDHVLDFGPGAGRLGGTIVATGAPEQVAAQEGTLTGEYLGGRRRIEVPGRRRLGNGHALTVRGARQHNLRNIDVSFPLGCLIAVTGVSGSGKSSLVSEILHPALARELHRAGEEVGAHNTIEGIHLLDKVINIDQRPIGDNPRSNPASYIGAFDIVRQFYAVLPLARQRGYGPERFSFNRPGGRCERCWGFGARKIEMHFLADVWVPCEECAGKRYNAETLEVTYRGWSIAEVLDATVADARDHFHELPRIRAKLQTLVDVGLDYLTLGQSALTLSGGEAQRVKLARELSRPSTGQTLYLLDEPTTGLHFEDVRRLLLVLDRLVEEGNTVVVIEHNLEVVKCADQVIDLGPEAGERGGELVVAGTPEQVAACPRSHTGAALRRVLAPEREVRLESRPGELTVIADAAERWHRLQMAFSHESEPQWTGEDLVALVGLLRGLDERVGEPDWRNREFVALRVGDDRKWWARIRTCRPNGLRLIVRTAKGRFRDASLVARAGLPTWRNLDPPLDRSGPRLSVKRRGELDEVQFELVRRDEFLAGGLAAVLADLLAAYCEVSR